MRCDAMRCARTAGPRNYIFRRWRMWRAQNSHSDFRTMWRRSRSRRRERQKTEKERIVPYKAAEMNRLKLSTFVPRFTRMRALYPSLYRCACNTKSRKASPRSSSLHRVLLFSISATAPIPYYCVTRKTTSFNADRPACKCKSEFHA